MSAGSNKKKDDEPLKSILEREGKYMKVVPWTTFSGLLLFIPFWAVTVLPITFFYQLGKSIYGRIFPKKEEEGVKLEPSSGFEVKNSDIIPHKDRKYDLVLLGASGFTGKFAVRHLLKTYSKNNDKINETLRWAVAGRSKSKLEKTLFDVAKELSIDQSIDIIVVDTSDVQTLPELVSNTRVVATTAGPFQLYGSNVVEFCAKFGTHYVDITGEVDWVRTMLVQWEETARSTGAKIVNFCGHDSIPWDLSVMKLANALKDKGEDLVEVRCFNEINGAASGGTLATALLAINGKATKSPKCDFDPLLRLKDGSKSSHGTKLDSPMFVSTSMKQPNEKENQNTVTGPFVMAAVNGSVVKRSTALRNSASSSSLLTYREACIFPDYKSGIVDFMSMIIFGTMLLNPLTQWLLCSTGVIPKPGSIMKGVTLDQMENEFYLCVVAEGIGSKGSRMESIMFFNRDAGYLDTARMLVESAICLALQNSNDNVGGGFFSPSIAMGDNLLERLCQTGTYYKMRPISTN